MDSNEKFESNKKIEDIYKKYNKDMNLSRVIERGESFKSEYESFAVKKQSLYKEEKGILDN